MKKKVKVKIKTITWWKKELDSVFSRYIRLKYAVNGITTCYTCGYQNEWKKLQNGHMVSRYYLNTRYDERNCRPQCYTCNMFRNGMIPDFSQRLEKELYEGVTKDLYRDANKLVHDFPYQTKVAYYKEKVKELLEKENEL